MGEKFFEPMENNSERKPQSTKISKILTLQKNNFSDQKKLHQSITMRLTIFWWAYEERECDGAEA